MENLQQLQFIFSETIGSHAQVDLIDFSRRPGGPFKWVLHYVDHHSGFAHVDCLPRGYHRWRVLIENFSNHCYTWNFTE